MREEMQTNERSDGGGGGDGDGDVVMGGVCGGCYDGVYGYGESERSDEERQVNMAVVLSVEQPMWAWSWILRDEQINMTLF